VRDILSTLGLVNALLLAVVMAVPGSVSYDELTASNLRFGLGSKVQANFYVDFNLTTVNPTYVGYVNIGNTADYFTKLMNKGPTLYDQFGSDDNFGYSNRLAFYIAGGACMQLLSQLGPLSRLRHSSPPVTQSLRCRGS